MVPLQQGDLDAFCGIYAVINAVNYLHGPLRQPNHLHLFELSLRYLAPKRCLIERAVGYGTMIHEIAGLLKLADQHYPIIRRKPFQQQSTIDLDAFWQQCQQFLAQPHTIILTPLSGTHTHWTLIHRMNNHTLFLWDSSHLKHLAKQHCQMAGHTPLIRRHILSATQTYFLRRAVMTSGFRAGEKPGEYVTSGPVTADAIMAMAQQLMRRKFARGRVLDSPRAAASYFPAHLALLEYETFWAVFLDNQHRVLAFEQLFRGTIDQAAVYPREVVKRALQLNAKAVIFAHNHPSGNSAPSASDLAITQRLKGALALVEVTVLDHFIIAADTVTSLAELGHC